MDGLTAADAGGWARLAVSAAADPGRRAELARRMGEAGGAFFAPGSAADELRAFFLESIAAARAGNSG